MRHRQDDDGASTTRPVMARANCFPPRRKIRPSDWLACSRGDRGCPTVSFVSSRSFLSSSSTLYKTYTNTKQQRASKQASNVPSNGSLWPWYRHYRHQASLLAAACTIPCTVLAVSVKLESVFTPLFIINSRWNARGRNCRRSERPTRVITVFLLWQLMPPSRA